MMKRTARIEMTVRSVPLPRSRPKAVAEAVGAVVDLVQRVVDLLQHQLQVLLDRLILFSLKRLGGGVRRVLVIVGEFARFLRLTFLISGLDAPHLSVQSVPFLQQTLL